MIDILLSRYRKLRTREKILVIAFTAVIAASAYHRFLYKPLVRDAATYKFQVQKLTNRLDELNEQYPALDKQVKNIEAATRGNEEIQKKIVEIENELPAVKDASRLTAELSRLASNLELVSVQQKMDEGELYSRIFVELRFRAPFNSVIDYIDKIEDITPFLKVEELSISEPKGKAKGAGLEGTLLVSCLLVEKAPSGLPIGRWIKKSELSKETAAPARDIFTSRSRPVAAVKAKEREKADFKLQGITFDPTAPTAIINDDVVRTGSEIDGFKVEEINRNSVKLSDGTEEFYLTLER